MKESMRTWEADVSYEIATGVYTVLVDTGEETVYFTRTDLLELLAMLDDADGSV